jgi:hypothetical protein
MGEFFEDITFEISVRFFKGDESKEDLENLKRTVEKNFQIFFPITIGTAEAKITEIKKDETEKNRNET